jgi:hypothetical protein
MDAKEAAKWIRATYPVFRAHPEKWGKGRCYDKRTRQVCALGGAACLSSKGEPFRTEDVFYFDGKLTGPVCEGIGRWLQEAVIQANDGARDVEDMISRVEAVLRKAGL